MKMTPWDVVSGSSIEVEGVCHIRQPQLADIKQLGYSTFFEYVGIIMFDPNELSEKIPLVPPNSGAFLFLVSYHDFREMLLRALPFFVEEKIEFNFDRLCFDVYKGEDVVARIDNDNFADIQSAVIQTVGGEKENEKNLKFQSKKAREIYEKCKARKKEFERQKQKEKADDSYALPNILSAVCAKHPSLNFTNIWSLTILQLYDQFKRLNINTYESVEGLRWAAWGKDSIEFSAWYKDLYKQ